MEEQAEQRHSMEIHEYALYIIGRRKQAQFEVVTRWEDGRHKKKEGMQIWGGKGMKSASG